MIHFSKNDDNRQFIGINITDGTDTKKVLGYISEHYPILNQILYKIDDEEIIFPLRNDIEYGFSLNALRTAVSDIAKSTVSCFCVDLELPSQRFNG